MSASLAPTTDQAEDDAQILALPAILGSDNIRELLAICETLRQGDNFILDARRYSFGSPIGLTLLKAAIHSHHPCRIKDIHWMGTSPASYLSRMNFFNNVNAPSVHVPDQIRHNRADRLVEISVLHHDGEVDDLAQRLSQALTMSVLRECSQSEDTSFDQSVFCDPITYLISELLLNATTHAKRYRNETSRAWVAAQARPATPSRPAHIEIAVADDGCGVLRTLADKLQNKTSTAEAIRTAMQPHVSCNLGVDFTGEETSNQGVGLYVASDMIKQAGGRMQIISGDCMYDSAIRQRRSAYQELLHPWQGVAISISIPFDRIHCISPTISLDKIQTPPQSGFDLNFS